VGAANSLCEEAEAWRGREESLARRYSLPWTAAVKEAPDRG
jgi:hypothetical protein